MTTLAYSVEETTKMNREKSDAKASVDMIYAQGVSDTLTGVGILCFFLFNLLRIATYLAVSSGLWSPLA